MSRRTSRAIGGNRVEGEPRSSHDTKAEAVERGRDQARDLGVEHITKNQDGTISERNSYGNDPRNIRG